MVGVNVPIPVPVAYYTFGGFTDSIFGDSKAYGMQGLEFYTRKKVMTSRWFDPSHGGVDLGFPQNQGRLSAPEPAGPGPGEGAGSESIIEVRRCIRNDTGHIRRC
jgi:hypothetical protein